MKLMRILETLKQESTPEFKRWFGNSVAVDSSGRPQIFYHGTGVDFDEFKIGRTGGIFFAKTADDADRFATGNLKRDSTAGNANIIPVYLSVKKPFIFGKTRDERMVNDYFDDYFSKSDWIGKRERQSILKNKWEKFEMNMMSLGIIPEASRSWLMKYGYDAIVRPSDTGDDIYGVFNPNQIKSAIGNSGKFSNSSKITETVIY